MAARTKKKKAASKKRTTPRPKADAAKAKATKVAQATKPSKAPRVRVQPLIAVRDVAESARWYANLLGLEALGDRHPDHRDAYDRIIDPKAHDRLVLQLHAREEEGDPKLGHGVLLWFELDDFDAAVARARELRAEVVEEPHVNPAPSHREMWLRDPDGYVVVICSPDGEAE